MIPTTVTQPRIGPRSAGLLLTPDEFDRLPKAACQAGYPEQIVNTAENHRRCDRAIWVGLGRTPDPEQDVKRSEFLNAGVVEYWVVDRFQRKMMVYAKTQGESVERVVQEAVSFATPLLPGFLLPLAKLLGRADLWSPQKRPRKPTA